MPFRSPTSRRSSCEAARSPSTSLAKACLWLRSCSVRLDALLAYRWAADRSASCRKLAISLSSSSLCLASHLALRSEAARRAHLLRWASVASAALSWSRAAFAFASARRRCLSSLSRLRPRDVLPRGLHCRTRLAQSRDQCIALFAPNYVLLPLTGAGGLCRSAITSAPRICACAPRSLAPVSQHNAVSKAKWDRA